MRGLFSLPPTANKSYNNKHPQLNILLRYLCTKRYPGGVVAWCMHSSAPFWCFLGLYAVKRSLKITMAGVPRGLKMAPRWFLVLLGGFHAISPFCLHSWQQHSTKVHYTSRSHRHFNIVHADFCGHLTVVNSKMCKKHSYNMR